LTKLASLSAEEKARGVIGISAGNHAQALAYCSALEGLDCLVVMWKGASPQKIEATQGYGAEVDLVAGSPGEAFERLDELIATGGRTLVHPFNDPRVIAGQGTVALELMEDVPDVDVVVCPVGGGGLISGIATAVKGQRAAASVIAVEPQGSAALHHALEVGNRVEIEPRSIADGLNAPHVGENCLAICRELVDASVLVSEAEIVDGMRFVYERAKLACEPAGAVGVAALLSGRIVFEEDLTAAVVISGGNIAARTAFGILDSDEA
jgi:threonine dehydratase